MSNTETGGVSVTRTYEQRHADAMEVLRTMSGVDAPTAEKIAAGMERRLGALGTVAMNAVMGDLWCRPQLSRRDRSLVVVSVLMAQARQDELQVHVANALTHGMSREEVDELLLHVAAYAGFPAAMHSVRIVDAAYNKLDGLEPTARRERTPAEHLDDTERDARAADVRRTLTNGRAAADPATDLANMVGLLGDVGALAYRFAFGEVWSRPQLSRRDRSLCVIAILAALGQTHELSVHVPGGLNHGLTRTEIEEVMVQMCLYAGFPRAVDGMLATRAAFAKIDARAAKA
ncbi:MAG: carboxymuconolactone decarboxylase family protein [Acidimicrobiales bacterium]